MKKFKKKIALTSIAALTSLAVTSGALAATPLKPTQPSNPSSGGGGDALGGLVKAIEQLGNQIKALSVASETNKNNMAYQTDQNLSQSMQANSQQSANAQARAQASTLTEDQIKDFLLQYPEQVVNATQLSDPKLAAAINNRSKVLGNLTVDTPASDTLYLNQAEDSQASLYGVAKPTTTYDNYFNFDTLFTPSAYTTDQKKAAEAYLQYATRQYQAQTKNNHYLSQLKSQLNGISDPTERARKLQVFVNSPKYQQYQLDARSAQAEKSIALSNLNQLLMERTPVKGLGKKAGLPDDPNLPSGDASPLQVENYIANERVDNPHWYQQVKTASSATVNREAVMILAEIESQLQRNHLDNERLLATFSAMELQSVNTASKKNMPK